MTLAQLTYFVAVAETGSFTLAAQREHVAQPSLSKQIKALEQELGGELIDRRGSGIRLTAAGYTLLPKARAAVQATRDGSFLARQALVEGGDGLCVASLCGAPSGLVAEAVARVCRDRPGLAVRVHVHATQARLEEKLRDGDHALGLGDPPSGEWEGPVVSLGERELVVVSRRDDDGLQEPVSSADLVGRPFVVLDGDEPRSLSALHDIGVEPISLVRTDTVDGVLALVGAGAGVALLDEDVLGEHTALRALRLADPPRREWALFAGTAWTPPALDLVAAIVTRAGAPVGVGS